MKVCKAFKVIVRNPITRNLVFKKMIEKGYKIPGDYTVASLNKKWPAKAFPVMFFFKQSPIFPTTGPCFDVAAIDGSEEYERTYRIDATVIPLGKLDSIPNANEPEVKPPQPVAEANKPGFTPAFVFPPAAKYSITYTKQDGTVGTYIISNPLEIGETNFTAYAYGRGIRSFNKDRVLTFARCE